MLSADQHSHQKVSPSYLIPESYVSQTIELNILPETLVKQKRTIFKSLIIGFFDNFQQQISKTNKLCDLICRPKLINQTESSD